ncbi:alpha-L-fucosidase [Croceivirga radicis]|uniref:alpha-L-fucosidase n=1 Tax=Croceivirga radicis TaxID=1929488 RepID=UPI000305EBAF|nr:alpha-L-fucosidase [Croceivirga radicis]
MASKWGFSLQDKAYKSKKELIQYLVKAAGHNSNFLLNVGPMPNGKIQPEFRKTLSEIGAWTKQYGESIYGTRSGPIAPQVWGVTTKKGKTIYVHILEWKDENFLLPKIDEPVKNVSIFKGKEKIDYKNTEFGTVIKLPKELLNSIDLILEVTVK